MRKHERARSAMGPSSEPGEAHPTPADEAQGLGGTGTEGGPGTPEGGTEPQLPPEMPAMTPEEEREAVERLRKSLEDTPDG